MEPASEDSAVTDDLLDRALRAGFARGAARDASLPPEPTCVTSEELARGGMGVVYRARDPVLGREIAVKLLREELAADPAAIERFLEEARIAGHLQHPGVVPVYALGRTATGRPYFTMKLIEGRTLAELLDTRRDPADEPRRFLAIFESVCRTVAYAHEHGVLHLDLKPSNVMVGSFGEVLVVDWGLAAVVANSASGERHTPAHGTPAYMPPERARGERVLDRRADVFALGATLCEILTGAPPYPGGRGAQRSDAVEARTDSAIARLESCGASPELIAIALRCLAHDPVARPASAAELAAALAADAARLDERARAAALAAAEARGLAREERRTRRLTVALALTITGSLAIAFGVRAVHARERDEHRQRADERAGVALEEASRLLGQAESGNELAPYALAATAAESAQSALASGAGSPELVSRSAALLERIATARSAACARAERTRIDATLLARLDALRLPSRDDDDAPPGCLDGAYATAFRAAGLDADRLAPAAFAADVRARGLELDVAAALDVWADLRAASCDDGGAATLRALALRTDPDPTRAVLRVAVESADQPRLLDALEHAEFSGVRAGTWLVLGHALIAGGPDTETVLSFFRRAQHAHPRDYAIAVELARLLFAAGHCDEGAGFYRVAQALRPERATPYAELGWELDHLDIDHAAAAELHRRAVELWPDVGFCYFLFGHALRTLGDIEGAVVVQREAARRMSGDQRPHKELALLAKLAGSPDEAIAEFEKVLAIEPGYVLARGEYAALLADRGRIDDALAQIRRAIEDSTFQQDAWRAREALLLLRRGDATRAAAILRELDSSVLLSLLELRARGARLGDFVDLARVHAWCEERVAAFVSDPETHCQLGVVLEALGRYQEAALAFRTGDLLGARQPTWRLPSALWFARAQELASVESELPAALAGTYAPRDARETFELARIASRRDLAAAADAWFSTALECDPALAERDLARLEAACAAVASGRVGGHARALAWLRDEISRLGARGASEVRAVCSAWSVARELRTVRDEPARNALPADEASAWRDAWAALAAADAHEPR